MATAEVKTKPTNLSVSKYLAAIKDPQRKRDCIELVKLMTASSGQKPRMWGTSIVGFGMRHVVSPSGR